MAWKSLDAAKTTFGGPRSESSTSAWYGARDLDPELFIEHARLLLRAQICPDDCSEAVCWGFKEIRYLNHLDELPAFLDFLSNLLPRAAIIFNTRDHNFVCKSAFWNDVPEKELRKKLALADRLFFEYADRNDNAFICRYERVLQGEQGLRPLFDFLGVQPDPLVLNSVIQTPHSYSIHAETLQRAAAHRERISLHDDLSFGVNHPCRSDSPFENYKSSGKVVVFCIVKDEIVRLPWYLKYYRRLGCRDFVFIDTGSKDGTVDYLNLQSDVYLYHAPADQLPTSRGGADWINVLGPKHAIHRWILLADIDENLTWPEQELEGLEGLITRAERLGLNRVFTPTIDIYPAEHSDTLSDYQSGEPYATQATLMDDVEHTRAAWSKGRLILYSRPRSRHLSADKRPPIMSKQNLYFVEHGGFKHIGRHFDTYALPSPLVVPLLHFKFFPDFKEKIKKAISEGHHWNNAADYNQYVAEQLPAHTLAFEGSVDYRSNQGLEKYIYAMSRFIRRSNLCGSVQWKKFATEIGGDDESVPQHEGRGPI